MARRTHHALAALTSLAFLGSPLAFAQSFIGSGLTPLPSHVSGYYGNNLRAISPTGVVVGSAPDEFSRPVTVWTNGVPTSLGTLDSYSSNGIAYGVNASGVIVGESDFEGDTRAFVYANGTMTDLGTFGGYNSHAYAVNSSGVIVGKAQDENDDYFAFRYSGGVMTNLGTLLGGPSSEARAINTSGVIAGTADINGLQSLAFVYANGQMTSLGVLNNESEYASSRANGINDNGTIVGSSSANANGDNHAFMMSGGVMTDLGTLGGGSFSEATGINSHGAIVGNYEDAQGKAFAFYYADNTMVDLTSLFASSLGDGSTTSGFTRLLYAYSINDSGQITGEGIYFNHTTGITDQVGFVLTVSAIPEPSTYAALAGLGALGLVLYRRRRSASASPRQL